MDKEQLGIIFDTEDGPSKYKVVLDLLVEREKQDEVWGMQVHHPAYWLAIMGKQVGQFGSAVLQREWWKDKEAAIGVLRHEAVQMGAVAMAIIEAIDRGNLPTGLVTAKPEDPRLMSRILNTDDESLPYDDDDGVGNGGIRELYEPDSTILREES